jgi:hypothetical protein
MSYNWVMCPIGVIIRDKDIHPSHCLCVGVGQSEPAPSSAPSTGWLVVLDSVVDEPQLS